MARTSSRSLAKESEGELDRKASQMRPERFSWQEDGRKRDFPMLAGRMSVSVKRATRRKAQKSTEIRREILEAFRKWEQKARTSKKQWKWQRCIVTHPLSEGHWNRRHFSMKKWEPEKHKSWGIPAGDGSLLGKAGKWGACGWAVVQLGYDERWCPCMGCTAQ